MQFKTINGTTFNLDYCKQFNAEKLRKIYNGEKAETLDLLIKGLGLEVVETKEEKPKKTKKEVEQNEGGF